MVGSLTTLFGYAWGEALEVPVYPDGVERPTVLEVPAVLDALSTVAKIAPEALAPGDIVVSTREQIPFLRWDATTNREVYLLTQSILRVQTDKDCMLYGVITEKKPFEWHIVPYVQNTGWSRIFQQLKVLFRVTFWARTVPLEEQQTLQEHYAVLLDKLNVDPESLPKRVEDVRDSSCPFCNTDNVKRQQVLEGDLTRILYDHAPITDGHVLIVPKRHCARFQDLTEKEYGELMLRVRQVAAYLFKEGMVRAVYVRQSNGPSAGQSVGGHVHFNVMPVRASWDAGRGRLEVLKRMTIGSTRLPGPALQAKVAEFTDRFSFMICPVEESF